MKIIRELVPEMTLEQFADQHGLVMKVTERRYADLPKYYAYFEHAEIRDGGMLIGTYGNGHTEDEAIKAYGRQISLKTLVIHAMNRMNRREIEVPRISNG